VPESCEYIDIEYTNINDNTPLYKSLQKGIYLDLFPNIDLELPIEEYLTQEKIV
jgi:hypothetical protein